MTARARRWTSRALFLQYNTAVGSREERPSRDIAANPSTTVFTIIFSRISSSFRLYRVIPAALSASAFQIQNRNTSVPLHRNNHTMAPVNGRSSKMHSKVVSRSTDRVEGCLIESYAGRDWLGSCRTYRCHLSCPCQLEPSALRRFLGKWVCCWWAANDYNRG